MPLSHVRAFRPGHDQMRLQGSVMFRFWVGKRVWGMLAEGTGLITYNLS